MHFSRLDPRLLLSILVSLALVAVLIYVAGKADDSPAGPPSLPSTATPETISPLAVAQTPSPPPPGQQTARSAPTRTRIPYIPSPVLPTPANLFLTAVPLTQCQGKIRPLTWIYSAPNPNSRRVALVQEYMFAQFVALSGDLDGDPWLRVAAPADPQESLGWVEARFVNGTLGCQVVR